ncbi:MAG TPA: alpha/beta hydrolase [Acidimicrobiia bacterium]|nr:alpha/beta hydrolase [Acidimicrobiia bacterium]
MDPRTVTVRHDGLEIAALDWGGDGPPLLLQHPNGFCAGVFDPLAQVLRGEYRPIGVDVRGHGRSEAPPDLAACTFVNAARDVLAVLDALSIPEVVALGQSMGGGALVLVDSLRPGTVRKVLLCEAIAFEMAPSGPLGPNPMAAAARKRRAVWPDRATVLASYGGRPPLDVMEPAALAAYVRYGFRDRDDGTVELACAPEVEARFFEAASDADGAKLAHAHLPAMQVPVTVVSSTGTNLPEEIFVEQAVRTGGAHHLLDGTHFFVQEDTARAAQLVREHLTW